MAEVEERDEDERIRREREREGGTMVGSVFIGVISILMPQYRLIVLIDIDNADNYR